MQFVEDKGFEQVCQITSCTRGEIVIQSHVYTHSIIVEQHQVTAWRPQQLSDLMREDFTSIIALKPEVIIFGVGTQLVFPAPQLLSDILSARIGIEVMDTRAACRTFNVLLSEGRKVVGVFLQE